ncbi:glycopeptide antibiotics resistance protein [Croceifilum oryzae]|uniref:Glycopeptide antibiotics resistance protein n=1 Tax=Croceifilum oryzae TaxID=1553429 RepID=A0AAJ1TFZ0_9BACL|nr:VanZ family protein [Croceifilum oryzae]MDQ0418158.1 glycopeptide antibiotics resistance protein [Croceifilum oryzae]
MLIHFKWFYLIPIFLIHFMIRRKQVPVKRFILEMIFLFYLALLVCVTLFPIPIFMPEGQISWVAGFNFIPFSTIETYTGRNSFWKQIGGNIALFAPFGFLIPLIWAKINRFIKTAGLALCLSVLIELLQMLGNELSGWRLRVIDIDDVILNVTGACIGYILLRLTLWIFRGSIRHNQNIHIL